MMSIKENIQFLSGGGEMGALMRLKDWSTTALGYPDEWPQSLRTSLSIILNSKFPMFLFWGPEHICFYNDAYRPSLGNEGKHPAILGGKGETYWPEIWPVIKPLIDQVMSGGESTWSEDQLIPIFRNNKLEDVYWTFSYSPVLDETGKPGGVFVTCNETTGNVLAYRQIEESHRRFRSNLMQAPVAMCIFQGQDHVVEIANELMLGLMGKTANEVIGKPVFEAVPEARNQGLEELVNHVFLSGQKVVVDARPIQLLQQGELKLVYVSFTCEALREVDGSISGIMVVATDVSMQVAARLTVEESDKRLRTLIHNAPFPIAVLVGKEMKIDFVNEAMIASWGKGDEVVGKLFMDVMPELESQQVFDQIVEVYNSGVAFHADSQEFHLMIDGKEQVFYYNYSFTPLLDSEGIVYGVLNSAFNVTDYTLAQKKIEEGTEKLNIVIEASELGTWELNFKTSEVAYSDRYLEIIGMQKGIHAEHKQLLARLHPEDLQARENAVIEAKKTGVLYYESRLIWKDGSIHWMEARGKVFYDSNGNPEKMVGTIQDTTTKKNHEHELIESEKRFRSLAEALPQLVWETDKSGNSLFASRRWEEFTGITPNAEAEWRSTIHPDDFEQNQKVWMNSLATGEVYRCDVRIRNRNGEYRWHAVVGEPVYDQHKRIAKWVGAFNDIHSEKEFSQMLEIQVKERTKELIDLNETLRESEERYHMMVNEVQDYAIIYLNRNGIIENWNIGAEKIKGYKSEEIIGKSFSVFYTEEDQKSQLPQKLLKLAADNGRAVQEGWRVKKNQERFWANVVITCMHNQANEIIGFSKVTHDLTEKKMAEDLLKSNANELMQKNIELEKMNKELESFAYISSHDLQEPLRKIQTFASLILEKELPTLSDNAKDHFQRMYNAAKRMQTLIEDLLAYSRSKTSERKFEQVDLNLIVQQVKEDLSEELQKNQAEIIVDVNTVADIIPFQFRQLLQNIVSNALKFSSAERLPRITIKSKIATGSELQFHKLSSRVRYCHLSISDNGIGFMPEYNEKIFEVFQRLHGREEYSGTGIGLAIVKKIVDNHHGFIEALGEPGVGATFDIYFPVRVEKTI